MPRDAADHERRPLARLTDAQLDAHLANLDSWLEFDLADIGEALAEHDRRAAASGRPPYAFSTAIGDYLPRRRAVA